MELFAAALATILVLVSLPGARAQESNMREDVRAVARARKLHSEHREGRSVEASGVID